METLPLSEPARRGLADAVASQANLPWQQSRIDSYATIAANKTASFAEIRTWLQQQFQKRPTPAALLLKNLPVDAPTQGYAKETSASQAILVSIASMIGEVLSYADQRGGQLVQDLYPRPEDAAKQLGTGSIYLEGHTEDAHLKYNCDFVGLLCLRGDPRALTLISQVQPELLAPKDLVELNRPQFIISGDDSYEKRNARPFPVVEQKGSDWKIRFDPLYTRCESDRAIEALRGLQKHIEETYRAVELMQGDLLLINNNVGVHARTAFTPRFDGTDRWVQRCTVYVNPIPSQLRTPLNNRLLQQNSDGF